MAIVVILLTIVAQFGVSTPGWKWLLAVAFLATFVGALLAVLQVEVRRQTLVISMTEVPLLLGLYYLSPMLLVLVVAVATLVVRSYQQQGTVKLWFNVVSQAAGAALAALIVQAGPPLDGTTVTTWLILASAVCASALVTLSAVIGVVTLVQGTMPSRDLVRMTVPGLTVSGFNIVVGLVVLIMLQQGLWSLVLLALVVLFFAVAYHSYARSIQHSRSLNEMYDLTRAIADTPHDGTLTDVFLGRVREMLQAEYATLWIPGAGRHPEVLLSAKVDYTALLDFAATPAALRRRAFESGETVAIGQKLGDQGLRSALAQAGVKDVIVVPLRAGSAVIGCLEVAGRIGDIYHFGQGDVRLLETIAGHAAVAVENSRLVERLRFDAYHDALTALPNRRRVTDGLEESVAVRTPGEVVAVLLLDVTGLRDVNESLGRAAGDQLLVEVAGRIREAAPSSALVGRIGGDAFAITLRLPDDAAALALASELRDRLRRPLTVGALTLEVDAAVGVVVHPEHGAEPATLLQRADVATQAAKGLSSGVQLFNQALESGSARRLGLAADLRQALDNDELEVHYQPKVSIADRRLVGVECLARWEHPAHGSVLPADFVAVAEHTGQLGKLTEAVLTAGLRRARQWADSGHPLPIAVNLSSRTLLDPEFPGRVGQLLAEHGVAPELLTFEIIEDGTIGELDRPLPVLHRLSELGIRLAVDDFGTGYSSLSYLRQLPVQEVKIDKSFVQGMATDAGDLAIVRTVVDLSRHFGLVAVAEGVESELTLNLLQEIGCEVGQGFLFSRPLPYERLEAWLAAQTDAEPSPAGQVRRLRAVG
ncbi:MAG: putative bifunctional diguanylate cyclase/phosphodiesterase [Natronosporangium sp.]